MLDSLDLTAMTTILQETLWQYPRTTLLTTLILLTLLTTRLITTLRFRTQTTAIANATHPISPPEIPYTIPFLKNATVFLNLGRNVASITHSNPTAAMFTLRVANSRHHFTTSPSISHHLLTTRGVADKLDLSPFVFRVMSHFWLDGGYHENMPREKYQTLHKYLATMMHSTVLNDLVPTFTSALSTQTADLCSFSDSIVDQHPWERAANVTSTSAGSALDAFFSPDLALNHPTIIEDDFLSETYLQQWLAGFPPQSFAPSAVRARDRIVTAMREHSLAYWKLSRGEDPGAVWANVGQTCKPMAERVLLYGSEGDFDEVKPEWERGLNAAKGNAAIVQPLQTNSPRLVFWMVWEIMRDPVLLKEVRDEIAPYVSIETNSGATHGGIQEKPRLAINAQSLRTQTPLLLGVFHEVLRMQQDSMTYKLVTDDFTVTESAEDAARFGAAHPRTYAIKNGDFVVIPHGLHNYDGRYWEDPESFDARRFWVKKGTKGGVAAPDVGFEKEEKSEELDKIEVDVSYLTTHPWGGGASVCKGKNFAIIEILLAVASIITLWDFSPVKAGLFPGLDGEKKWERTNGWKSLGGREGGIAGKLPSVMVEVRRRGV
ncbi:uncharacterized protein AB675_8506 [Cyphellophora attinorum]|uniref:25-hydroxycholesterol 7-alpha-hydroxylase n=1 Tax=Cyphellophora attinorum TaxID=1664694 RepID=A0A0N1H9T6_9EURO|nr:uncharacterized protein AB675_8506 [Phialophora attinorum]KPI44426.1 hypothetical protein AB675_8506 [Phialophora attinorum]